MASISIKLPDGSDLELPEGASGADAAAGTGPGLARDALAIRVDGELRDLGAPVEDGVGIEILTAKSDGALDLLRHDAEAERIGELIRAGEDEIKAVKAATPPEEGSGAPDGDGSEAAKTHSKQG